MQAIEIARSQKGKCLELNAVKDLSQLWQRQGKREDARELLAGIYGSFTEGFDTPALKQAKTLLDELS